MTSSAVSISKGEAKRRYPILGFFEHDHLPERLQDVSKPFSNLAWKIATAFQHHPAEVAACLRKLLEAKDAAVRAALYNG